MSYPSLLANGLNAQTAFTPFELYAGESDIVSTHGQASAAGDIAQFAPVARDENGDLVTWSPNAGHAAGTVTVSGVGTAADTLTINGTALTLVASGAGGHNVLIGGTSAVTAANLLAAINADPDTFHVHATLSGLVITLTALEGGTGGNSIALAKSSTALAVSGAALSGGSDQSDDNAIGIAAQPIPASTKGPIFIGGVFNVDALAWPAGLTDAQKYSCFDRTDLSVRKLI